MWAVYVVKCSDGSFYCGVTNNVPKRIHAHSDGKGAKYTRSRLPVKLLRVWVYENKSAALKAEHAFKKLTRAEKETKLEI